MATELPSYPAARIPGHLPSIRKSPPYLLTTESLPRVSATVESDDSKSREQAVPQRDGTSNA